MIVEFLRFWGINIRQLPSGSRHCDQCGHELVCEAEGCGFNSSNGVPNSYVLKFSCPLYSHGGATLLTEGPFVVKDRKGWEKIQADVWKMGG